VGRAVLVDRVSRLGGTAVGTWLVRPVHFELNTEVVKWLLAFIIILSKKKMDLAINTYKGTWYLRISTTGCQVHATRSSR